MGNRLAEETSPYLLQHAHNPVDWYPWGPEALGRARDEGKPILLSVGYSACHWCHVMERESFEDEATAERMNRGFVNIKVDREERPDVDALYMKAVQAFTGGHGGWPMTVFLTPDGRPFFGGTYFPPESGRGMPSFTQVLEHAQRLYSDPEVVVKITEQVLAGVRPYARLPRAEPTLATDWLERVASGAAEDFDSQWGGFGRAPKFPPHGTLAVLLAHWSRSGDARSLEMVVSTLDAMARGGMYDLLGGGFARYSVDPWWRIPHFEKMLYDNAQLVPIYVDAWRATGAARFARVARESLDWTLREMTREGGGFYSAQDADSEGEEGRFFAWTPKQIEQVLGADDGPRVCELLQVSPGGSFEHGSSVLRLEEPLESQSEDDRALLRRSFSSLFAARSERIAPGLDDKIITCWNGLMISALARAGAALPEPRYIEAAVQAAAFIDSELVVDGRLHRTWKDGRCGPGGFLDDYAALCGGLIDLWEATFERRWLDRALELADSMVELFWDEEDGGFFYAGHDAERLVARSKNLLGGAVPSGNGLAALACARLETLCGRKDLGQRAERVARSYQVLLQGASRALGPEALAAAWLTGPVAEIGIVGTGEAGQELLASVRARCLPFAALACVAQEDVPGDLVPWLDGKVRKDGSDTAYVCRNHACRAPATTVEALDSELDALLG